MKSDGGRERIMWDVVTFVININMYYLYLYVRCLILPQIGYMVYKVG